MLAREEEMYMRTRRRSRSRRALGEETEERRERKESDRGATSLGHRAQRLNRGCQSVYVHV